MFELALGCLLAILTILLFRRAGPPREHALWALALAAAALIYVGFALAGGEATWTVVELGGLSIFAFVAWAGWRLSPWWLAAGWLAHAGWDLGMHGGRDTPFVPAWYPAACLAYDVVVGVYVGGRAEVWISSRGAAPGVA